MDAAPIAFNWDGEAMSPVSRRFALQADKQYVVGETYTLVPLEQRSAQSHKHYFAALHDAWMNLPEEMADELPTSEHLRAWALVKGGFADKSVIKCASNDDAVALATVAKGGSKIRIVEIIGKVVTVWTPHSQSLKSMGKATFQRSKDAVLDIAWGLCGVAPAEAKQHAGKAA